MSIIKGVRINDISDGMHIAALAEFEFCPLSQRVIARVTPQGQFLGGCVLDDYTGQTGSIRIHVGLTGHCFTRDFLYIGFSYVFDQLLVRKLFAFVPRSRPDVFHLALKFGFKPEAGIADYFPSDDMIMLAMYRHDCRFLRARGASHGQSTEGAATARHERHCPRDADAGRPSLPDANAANGAGERAVRQDPGDD